METHMEDAQSVFCFFYSYLKFTLYKTGVTITTRTIYTVCFLFFKGGKILQSLFDYVVKVYGSTPTCT